jgi:hypothetical protein
MTDAEKISALRLAIQNVHHMAQLRSPNTDDPIATMIRICEYCYRITKESEGWGK